MIVCLYLEFIASDKPQVELSGLFSPNPKTERKWKDMTAATRESVEEKGRDSQKKANTKYEVQAKLPRHTKLATSGPQAAVHRQQQNTELATSGPQHGPQRQQLTKQQDH